VVGASGLWPALVDSSQLENALLNLCLNARDAMPDGDRITIETAYKWLDEYAARQHGGRQACEAHGRLRHARTRKACRITTEFFS